MNNFSMKEVQVFWDSVADIYEDEHEKIDEIHNQRFTEAVKYLNVLDEGSILNIWSRDGGAIPFLRELNPNCTLVNCELSHEMTKIGKKNYPQESFIECSLHQFPFEDDKFDCVVSLETLEHVPDPVLFLKEVQRVLKKGGLFVMSTPPATAEYVRKVYELFFTDHGEGPHKFLSSRKVKSMLSDVGFKLRKHKGTVFLPIEVAFIKKIEAFMEPFLQTPFLREFGIRQFYISSNE